MLDFYIMLKLNKKNYSTLAGDFNKIEKMYLIRHKEQYLSVFLLKCFEYVYARRNLRRSECNNNNVYLVSIQSPSYRNRYSLRSACTRPSIWTEKINGTYCL